MKKKLTALLCVCGIIGLFFFGIACVEINAPTRIGVAMPAQDLQRWNQDGFYVKSILEADGYAVDLQYANNDPLIQVSQIESMLNARVKALVIVPIDSQALHQVLEEAKKAKIPVISYDRLILNSDAVSYYATFDNYQVGTMQGKYLVEQLGLADGKGPYHIELFAGSSDDNNARFFYQGAIDILKPYFETQQLLVLSGQTSFERISIAGWKSERARARMDSLLLNNYPLGVKLDAVLSPNDSVSLGVIQSLDQAGFGKTREGYPLITGQDCDLTAVRDIQAGKQSMSIFKDTRILAEKVAGMVKATLKEQKVEINDTTTYHNGEAFIPTYFCEPVFVDIQNYQEVLIDSNYYQAQEI